MDVFASTFTEALETHARERPNQPALRFEGKVTDYATVNEHANQIGNALLAMGIGKGARIAYVGKNSDHAIELVLGAAKAGVVFVPIIWRLAEPEIDWILNDSGAAALFVEPGFAARARHADEKGLPVILMGEDGGDPHWPRFTAWRDAASKEQPPVTITPDDVVLQLYTSGTTGHPKGAMLTHANGCAMRPILHNSGLPWLKSEPGEALMLAMPYGHIAGVGGALLAIYSGQDIVVMTEFDPGATLETIEQHRIRKLFLVPAALKILLEHPRAATTDFSSIQTFSYGASPIPLDLLKQGVEVLKCGFVQMYGMTETWGTVVSLPPEDHLGDKPHVMRSAGKALPGVEIRILDEEGNVLPPNTVGEIAIKSPANMKGYWNRPEETARTLIADGWLRTGDAGLLDEEGYLFIQDRIKDMIITGAENVYPAEVESAVYGHPDVADVAVIGVPDEKWGEAVKAIVVPKPGTNPDPASIIAFARERIAGFKCPKTIDFIDALPRNPSGKILRRQLREPYWAGLDRRVN